jgi:hypothetical protein
MRVRGGNVAMGGEKTNAKNVAVPRFVAIGGRKASAMNVACPRYASMGGKSVFAYSGAILNAISATLSGQSKGDVHGVMRPTKKGRHLKIVLERTRLKRRLSRLRL